MSEALAAPVRFEKKNKVFEVPAPGVALIDTHAHMTSFWEKRPAEVLARAAIAGVRGLVTLFDPYADGYTPAGFARALDGWIAAARELLAQERPWGTGEVPVLDGRRPEDLFDHIRYLAGVHPYGAPDYTDAVHAAVVEALADARCVGIGEIGLDYHFDAVDDIEAAPHDIQMACMARQLALAVERDLPVELHLRNDADDVGGEAHHDAYRVLTEVGVPKAGCVLHCFGEDRACMERFCELGCYIAYGGAATFKRNDAVREAFAATPLDRILFETDCPYMAPEPIRGLECEPAMVAITADALARDRAARTGEDPDAILEAARTNARRLFGC